MRSTEIELDTSSRRFVDITRELERFIHPRDDGLLNVFVPHATAGIAVMESGSGSEPDLEEVVSRLLPRDDRWTHRHGSRGHGADHVLPAFISPSVTIPVAAGRLALGTWQSVVVVDLNADNPHRKVRLSFLGP
jgi:secondary thiamine-phosphate synthase enzyme